MARQPAPGHVADQSKPVRSQGRLDRLAKTGPERRPSPARLEHPTQPVVQQKAEPMHPRNNIRHDVADGRGSPTIEEAARKTVAVRFGRGRGGGSTGLDALIQRALTGNRPVIIADGDRRNPTLAGLYPPGSSNAAIQPGSDEPAVVKAWITDTLSMAIERQSSVVFDMGGGDTAIQELVADIDIVGFAEMSGFHPLGLFFCGADMDDFDHIVSIWRAGYFKPKRAILVLNEFLIPSGRKTGGAFRHIHARPEMKELAADGMEVMYLPRLPCMENVRAKGLGFFHAMNGKVGSDGLPLDPVRRFMVRQWLARIDQSLASIDAAEWVP